VNFEKLPSTKNANDAIDGNLLLGLERGKLSTNILAQLRNLVDTFFFMFCEKDHNVSLEYDWNNIPKAKNIINAFKMKNRDKEYGIISTKLTKQEVIS